MYVVWVDHVPFKKKKVRPVIYPHYGVWHLTDTLEWLTDASVLISGSPRLRGQPLTDLDIVKVAHSSQKCGHAWSIWSSTRQRVRCPHIHHLPSRSEAFCFFRPWINHTFLPSSFRNALSSSCVQVWASLCWLTEWMSRWDHGCIIFLYSETLALPSSLAPLPPPRPLPHP